MRRRKNYLPILCASLVIPMAAPAFTAAAADIPAVVYDGDVRKIRLEDADQSDLFPEFKDMMPGDKTTQKIEVETEHTSGPVTVYLTSEGTAAEDPELFRNVILTVQADGEVIASESLADGIRADGVELFTFEEPGKKTLEVTLEVSEEAGNELMDAEAAANWKFTVQDESSGNTVRIRALDLTAYTGGDSMNDSGFPAARYEVETPEGVDLSDLTFYIDGKDPFEIRDDGDGDGILIEELDEAFLYQSDDGVQEVSGDDTAPGYYEIGIREDGKLTAKTGDDTYSVAYEPGQFTVRYVTDPEGVVEGSEDIATPVITAPEAEETKEIKAAEGKAATAPQADQDAAVGVVSPDTRFRTNGKHDIAGLEEGDTTGQISLLCDDILALGTDTKDRVEQMTGRAEDALTKWGYTLEERQYEFKYLDLVNEHDGNVWVSSSEGVDVYYPYPEGTSYETADDTAFTILHFKDLHREYGFEPGETIEELIASCRVEAVAVEATPYGLKFHVPESGFSPFAVTWQPADLSTRPDQPGGDGGQSKPAENGADETAGDAVRTGDTSDLIFWAGLMAAVILAVIIWFALRRRQS